MALIVCCERRIAIAILEGVGLNKSSTFGVSLYPKTQSISELTFRYWYKKSHPIGRLFLFAVREGFEPSRGT